jgi:hypothetical protein
MKVMHFTHFMQLDFDALIDDLKGKISKKSLK